MNIISNSIKPIFIQVKEWLENEILEDRINVNDKALSQNELARLFGINPMTALKGIAILESNGVLIKRRGVGMFVTDKAKEIIYHMRTCETLNEIIDDLVAEATVLKIDKEDIMNMIEERFGNLSGGEND